MSENHKRVPAFSHHLSFAAVRWPNDGWQKSARCSACCSQMAQGRAAIILGSAGLFATRLQRPSLLRGSSHSISTFQDPDFSLRNQLSCPNLRSDHLGLKSCETFKGSDTEPSRPSLFPSCRFIDCECEELMMATSTVDGVVVITGVSEHRSLYRTK